MEPPPAPPHSAAAPQQHLYPDSLDSCPRSRNSLDDSMYQSVHSAVSKLRLMCSYGGYIVPRPHDKSLCYVGGETRIIVVDRRTTLSDLTHRLSKNLRYTQSFILKYHLPNEDLDSLITITTDEDLENMIDEHDRLISNKSSRLRLFLFPSKPDSVSSLGSTKSGEWFLNALNGGGTGGFSDSSSVNCLLSLYEDTLIGPTVDSSVKDTLIGPTGPQIESLGNVKGLRTDMVEMTSSSFDSASSSRAVAILPSICAPGDDQKVGLEEQLAQISVVSNVQQRQDSLGFVGHSPDYQNQVFADDKKSEQRNVIGNRKLNQSEPLPPQLLQKQNCSFDFPSPDSVSSDGSISNPLSRQKPILQIQTSRSFTNAVESNIADSIIQMQQPQGDYGYLQPSQFDPQMHHQQQQFIPNHHPLTSYYPIYPQNQHHIHHSALDHQQQQQQYNPVYYVPAKQASPAPKPEIGSVPYTTTSTGGPGLSQMNLRGNNVIYGHEFAEPMQAQYLYYNRAQPKDNVKQQQVIRTTSQP